MVRPVAEVDQEQVLVAVVVVIEERGAAADGLGHQAFAISAVDVHKVDAGSVGDVGEAHRRRSIRRRCRQRGGRLHLGLGDRRAVLRRAGEQIAEGHDRHQQHQREQGTAQRPADDGLAFAAPARFGWLFHKQEALQLITICYSLWYTRSRARGKTHG